MVEFWLFLFVDVCVAFGCCLLMFGCFVDVWLFSLTDGCFWLMLVEFRLLWVDGCCVWLFVWLSVGLVWFVFVAFCWLRLLFVVFVCVLLISSVFVPCCLFG